MTCFQATYLKKSRILLNSDLIFRQLDNTFINIVSKQYRNNAELSYITERIGAGAIYGAFINNELCGFLGTHEEGGIGIMEVMNKYRRQGIGTELAGFMINHYLDQGLIPYGQILIDNEASLHLHRKLGYDFLPKSYIGYSNN
jgi:GNAT superfamily N-acetyltransferase